MIRRGWTHDALEAMSERDFCSWLAQQVDYDKAEAEARRKAIERASKR